MGRRWRTDPTPRRGRQVQGPSVYVSVWQRLIELEGPARSVVGNGFRIGEVEPAGLIKLEDTLGRRPSRRQWRRSAWEIEIGQNGANRNGIGDEGNDAHRGTTTTLRAVPGQTSGRTS